MRVFFARLAARLLVRALGVLTPDDCTYMFDTETGKSWVPLGAFGAQVLEVQRLTKELAAR